jgi:hypothetical protein
MELTKAYAVLGVEDTTSLEIARQAFDTWYHLYSVAEPAADWDGTKWSDAASVLALHELDVAWDTVERAHSRTAKRWRRPQACEECNRGPALQVTFTRTMPGVRARTQTTTATLCRECGLALFESVQRKNLRTGWWGVAAPFRNVSAVTANKVEARFLRGIGAPQGRKPAAPDPFVAAAAANAAAASKLRHSRTRRALPWVTGLAAIAITVGVALPAGGGETPAQAPGTGTSAAATPH